MNIESSEGSKQSTLYRQLSFTMLVVLIVMLIVGLLLSTGALFFSSTTFRERQRVANITNIAHAIEPLIVHYDLGDIQAVLSDVKETNRLLSIELVDFYGARYFTRNHTPLESPPDYVLELSHDSVGHLGELRVWWGRDGGYASLHLRSLALALLPMFFVLIAGWFVVGRIIKRNIINPISQLRTHIYSLESKNTTLKVPVFSSSEFNDLTASFNTVWSRSKEESEAKELALAQSKNELERRLAMTSALENVLSAAATQVCYYPEEGLLQNIVRVGMTVPYEVELAISCRDESVEEISDRLRAQGIELSLVYQKQSRVSTSVSHNTYFAIEISTKDEEIWSVVCVALSGGGRAYICSDVTQQIKVNRLLQDAKKLEAVGVLTSGVAHDFNNILAIISNAVELEQLTSQRDSERLDLIKQASQRGARLTKQLLDTSRRKTRLVTVIDQAEILANLSAVLPATIGQDHFVELCIETTQPVLAEEDLLETTLINLAINARDAMPLGGTIRIVAHEPTSQQLALAGLNSKINYVAFDVVDSGCGITGEIAEQMFDPFYTTKSLKGGTGLGLSMALAFSKRSGGTITFKTRAEGGSIFTLLLKAHDGGDKNVLSVPESTQHSDIPSSAWERRRVLVVDDEEAIREIICQYLILRGADVTVADGYMQARDIICSTSESPFDLVLSDMYMPDGTGQEITSLFGNYANKPLFILMSGNIDEDGKNHNVDVDKWLLKPFNLQELDALIQ